MVDVQADVTLPVSPVEAFDAATDLEHADWLPAVRGLRHVGGPVRGQGARYEVEVGVAGRHLDGLLVCWEIDAPRRALYGLERGIELSIEMRVVPVAGGCRLELGARYRVGSGPFAAAVERASQSAARHEVARALERLSARFARKEEEV